MFDNNFYSLSWEKANINLLRLQRHIIKAVYVGDFFYAIKLQKLLVISNSARLLAIRFVVQSSNTKTSLGLTNNLSLSSLERFKISNFILKNVYNWSPQQYKDVLVTNEFRTSSFRVRVWSIYDRCWQCLIKFAIEPVHRALSSPRSYNADESESIYNLQRTLYLNFSKESYASQKRVLIVTCSVPLIAFDNKLLLKNVLAPRSIKLGIFRFLKLGLTLDFNSKFNRLNFLGFILMEFLFSNIDSIINGVRIGTTMMIFLKPIEDEISVFLKLTKVFNLMGIFKEAFTFKFVSILSGFDFLDWNYRFYPDRGFCCVPSLESYRLFLTRVKSIVNNSNYGSLRSI